MAQITIKDITLEVERLGDIANPAVFLIAGLGFQLIDWPLSFAESLVDAGYQVIRFDNRDIGLSQKFEDKGLPDLGAILQEKMAGGSPDVPYELNHMAADVIGLMDAFAIDKAHIVGMSMGGMVAQILAANYASRCLSLTSIMSTTGDPGLPQADPETMAVLVSAPPSQDKQDIVEFGLKVNDTIGSPGYRWDRSALQTHIEACFERSYCPTGYMRQLAAVSAAQPRRKILSKVTAPTLVIHGEDDLLVPSSGGRDVADHVPGATFNLVPGMGHDLSPSLCDHLAALILPHLNDA
ncbi:MAG: alpha/beta fold hydrolase [Sneathiella sp.]|nr:alpha/beta fold hydrolase [Sneathiella sp.]